MDQYSKMIGRLSFPKKNSSKQVNKLRRATSSLSSLSSQSPSDNFLGSENDRKDVVLFEELSVSKSPKLHVDGESSCLNLTSADCVGSCPRYEPDEEEPAWMRSSSRRRGVLVGSWPPRSDVFECQYYVGGITAAAFEAARFDYFMRMREKDEELIARNNT
mmetsp:Transcript_11709/g.15287  ORF Transcript_11709/g.15287 Transcript_11709/m.15287 type:complete len:161 (+) Transcript_11709:118-600(+)